MSFQMKIEEYKADLVNKMFQFNIVWGNAYAELVNIWIIGGEICGTQKQI